MPSSIIVHPILEEEEEVPQSPWHAPADYYDDRTISEVTEPFLPKGVPGGESPTPGQSRGTQLVWLLAAIATQSAQGVHTVCCRYLQTQTVNALPPMQLNFLINAVAALGLLVVTLPTYLYRTITSPLPLGRTAGPCPYCPLGFTTQRGHHSPLLYIQHTLRRCLPSQHQAYVGLMAGVFLGSLGALNLLSVRFTEAYWSQLMLLTSPVMVALLSRFMFNDKIVAWFWPTIGLMGAGALLVVLGGTQVSRFSSHKFDVGDVIGMGLAAAAALSLALYVVLVQQSQGVVSSREIMWVNFVLQTCVCGSLSLALEDTRWDVFWRFGAADWAAFLFASLGVSLGANLLQQRVIHAIGGPLFATFFTCRLLANVGASYAIMGEHIHNTLQMCGIGIIVLAITTFLGLQFNVARRVGSS